MCAGRWFATVAAQDLVLGVDVVGVRGSIAVLEVLEVPFEHGSPDVGVQGSPDTLGELGMWPEGIGSAYETHEAEDVLEAPEGVDIPVECNTQAHVGTSD